MGKADTSNFERALILLDEWRTKLLGYLSHATLSLLEAPLRSPMRLVELNDIIASEILRDGDEVIAIVLKVHLALEALLIEALHLKAQPGAQMPKSFPGKTRHLAERQFLSEADEAAFNRFNDFRNDIAHTFGHSITLQDALRLALELETLGIDFSDSVGSWAEEEAAEAYGGTQGVIVEIAWCLLSHASFLLAEGGGRNVFSSHAT